MLRVAILYQVLHRNDGNPLYIFHALKKLEAQGKLIVDHLNPDGNYGAFGQYDIMLVVDWGEDGLTGMLPYKVDYDSFPAKVKINWCSDTHLGYDYRMNLAKKFDLVFVAQKDAVDRFKADGVDATWLPHAFEPKAWNDEDDETGFIPYNFINKKYDLCFVGHINSTNRIMALDRMFREFPNFFYGQKLFNDAAKKYVESKVVFNIAMKDDLNMRCFEVMGSKSFLLTDRVQSIDDLFIDGKHCVMYDSIDEAVDKARYYMANDEMREAIAESGYEHVMAKHTIDHRLEVILNQAFAKYPELLEKSKKEVVSV